MNCEEDKRLKTSLIQKVHVPEIEVLAHRLHETAGQFVSEQKKYLASCSFTNSVEFQKHETGNETSDLSRKYVCVQKYPITRSRNLTAESESERHTRDGRSMRRRLIPFNLP